MALLISLPISLHRFGTVSRSVSLGDSYECLKHLARDHLSFGRRSLFTGQMEVFRPKPINSSLMSRFHSDDYINFLRIITPDNMPKTASRFGDSVAC